MTKRKTYELSKFLSLENDIETDGERIIRNTYTGSRLKITLEIVKILEQFKTPASINETALRLGVKTRLAASAFKTLCGQLIDASMLVSAKAGEIDNEIAFCKHIETDPLSIAVQTFANCPAKRLENLHQNEIAFLGIPLDTATSVQPGTRFGPDSIRETSIQYITYERSIFTGANQGWFNADLGKTILAGRDIADIGNIVVRAEDDLESVFGRISMCINETISRNIPTVTIGGDHSISAPIIGAYAKQNPELVVLHFDAHTDLASWIPGKAHHHGSFMRRVMYNSPETHIYQYGARGFSGEASASDRYHINHQHVLDRMFEAGTWESVLPRNRKCYITLDVDVVDPVFAPGVGTPVPFGMSPFKLCAMLETIARHNEIVAIDIVELCPANDRSGSTSNLLFHLLVNLMSWAWDK